MMTGDGRRALAKITEKGRLVPTLSEEGASKRDVVKRWRDTSRNPGLDLHVQQDYKRRV